MSIRLFTGIFIPASLHERLALLQGGVPQARWVDPANFHITLSFLGDIEEGRLDDLDAALGAIRHEGFSLTLDGTGQFGNAKPRNLWVGVARNRALETLQAKAQTALLRAGFALEARVYKPHVTLCYLGSGAQQHLRKIEAWHEGTGAFLSPSFAVEHFSLIRSDMGQGGSHYTELSRYPLKDRQD